MLKVVIFLWENVSLSFKILCECIYISELVCSKTCSSKTADAIFVLVKMVQISCHFIKVQANFFLQLLFLWPYINTLW